MDTNWIIGALAFFTIGSILAVSIFHFGFYLKDPRNLAATQRVTADKQSAATLVSTEVAGGRSLRQRLDEAPSINDRLSNRPVGTASAWTLMFDTKWAAIRSVLRGQADKG